MSPIKMMFDGFLDELVLINLDNPDDSIVAHYKFNAGEGDTLYDHSGNGNHGTIHGATWECNDMDVCGVCDGDNSSCTGSAQFDGYHSRIRVVDYMPVNEDANQSAYAITGDAITVEAWVFPTNMNNDNGYKSPIILRSNNIFGVDPYFTYMLYIDNSRENSDNPVYGFSISDGIEGGSVETVLSNTPVTYEEWMHVSGTFDGTDLMLYLNGELDATESSNLSVIGEGGIGLYVGGPFWYESLRYFEGLIDEVRLWDVTRSQGEISESYNIIRILV